MNSVPHEQCGHHARGGHPGDDGPQHHPGLPRDDLLVPEHEEGDAVGDDARAHVHCPEYPRVSVNCCLIRVVSKNCPLRQSDNDKIDYIDNLCCEEDGRPHANDDRGDVDGDCVEVQILRQLRVNNLLKKLVQSL